MYSNFVFSQEFFETDSILTFPKIYDSTLHFVDVDGDNNDDVVTIGWNNGIRNTNLFTNDGHGNFIEDFNTQFEHVSKGDIASADIDGDGDLDLLICGMNAAWKVRTSLYINQGDGTFLENLENPLEDIWNGEVAFCDVDGDTDQDIFIVGQNESYSNIAKLYLNDGNGTFDELLDTPFIGVRASSIGIGDIDNDNDKDIIISGWGDKISTYLYFNDGDGIFTRNENSNIFNATDGSIALSDVDRDSDQDILITGIGFTNADATYVAKLYINNGLGNFIEDEINNFKGVIEGAAEFEDIDGDSDEDLFITGLNQSLKSEIRLYLNNGLGNFTELQTSIKSVYEGDAAFSDIDKDFDPDLLIIGRNSVFGLVSTLYINEWLDDDGDGFLSSVDCDDSNPNINQNQIEVSYNGIDEDCNPGTLDDDLDRDGYLLVNDCDDNNQNINPDQTEKPYNGTDDDCDSLTLDDDIDQDGFLFTDDCDDNKDDINPNAEEIPNNGIDEDCDGMDLSTGIHEKRNSIITFYPNPVSGLLKIEIEGQLDFIVSLYDLSGKLLLININKQVIDLSSISHGTYWLKIKDPKTGYRILDKLIIIGK